MQADLAKRVGVSGAYVSALETGRKGAPPFLLVESLARVLNCRTDELWTPAQEERRARLLDRVNGTRTSDVRVRTAAAEPGREVSSEQESMDQLEDACELLVAAPDLVAFLLELERSIPDLKTRAKVVEGLRALLRSRNL